MVRIPKKDKDAILTAFYYSFEKSTKDVTIFKAIEEKFDIGRRTCMRYKKRLNWDLSKPPVVNIENVDYNRDFAKPAKPEKQKKASDPITIIPTEILQTPVTYATELKLETGEYYKKRIEVASELRVRGLRWHLIRNYIEQAKSRRDPVWSTFDMDDFELLCIDTKETIINRSCMLDAREEVAISIERKEYMYYKLIEAKNWIGASKVEHERTQLISYLFGNVAKQMDKVDEFENYSDEEIIEKFKEVTKAIEDAKQNR